MKENKTQLSVAILLTTHNGSNHIERQLQSIINQQNVYVKLFISDDLSTDNTLELVKKIIPKNQLIVLKNKSKFGKPGLNFFSLINRVEQDEFDYYAFSDQDDVWEYNKLIEGISLIKKTNSDAYSSGFHLFYEDKGINKFVSKNPTQKLFDYLFSSPGPGCTFILKNKSYNHLRLAYINNKEIFNRCEYHDWAIYAFFRAKKLNWVIDNRSFIKYRQHEFNDTGANYGLLAIYKRLLKFKDGTYENQIKNIVLLTKVFDPITFNFLKTNSAIFYYRLLLKESRREIKERLLIFLISFLGLIKRKNIFYD